MQKNYIKKENAVSKTGPPFRYGHYILKVEFWENTIPLKLNKLCIAFREKIKEM